FDIGMPNTYTSAEMNSSMSRSLSWSACRICGECWSGGEKAAAIQSSVTCGGGKDAQVPVQHRVAWMPFQPLLDEEGRQPTRVRAVVPRTGIQVKQGGHDDPP